MAVPVRVHVSSGVVECYLARMAEHGAHGKSGVWRASYDQAWVIATQHYGAWRRDAGLDAWQDAVGNDRGRLEGSNTEPSIVSGSQINSQRPGGQFDGTLGAPRGRIKAEPGSPAIVTESVAFTIDARHPAPDQRRLYHQQEQRKGTVSIGGDAELLVWDPNAELTISQVTLHHASDCALYEDYRVLGLQRTVTLRGEVLVQDREFVGEPGKGEFLRRGPSGFQKVPGKAQMTMAAE